MDTLIKYSLTFLLLTLTVSDSFANSRTQVISDTESLKLSHWQAQQINNRVIYHATDESGPALIARDNATGQSQVLYSGELMHPGMVKIGDEVFFASESDADKFLWKSDGSLSGTTQLSSTQLHDTLIAVDSFVLSKGINGDLVISDGIETTSHQQNFLDPESTCVFDLDHVISLDFDLYEHTTHLVLFQNSQATIIDTPREPDYFLISNDVMFAHNGFCYVKTRENFMKIDSNGEVEYLNDAWQTFEAFTLFPFQDQLYVIGNDDQGNFIGRLSSNSSELISTFRVDWYQWIYGHQTYDNMIAISTSTPSASPPINISYFLNPDLIQIGNLGGPHINAPTPHPFDGGHLFMAYRSNNGSVGQHLAHDVSMTNLLIEMNDSVIESVASDAGSGDVFLQLRDKLTLKRSIEWLTEKPSIGKSINGLWYDPEIENQGISIHQGQRPDGSEYVFVTVYTFKDDEPFWLAGVADITHPQSSLSVTLANFQGGQMFQSGNSPTQNTFGTVELEMTGCNQIKASLQSGTIGWVLNLKRIDNTQFSHLCLE